MTPEERNLIAGVFDRMRQAANAERDAEAERFINEQVRMQPYAPYVMAQSMIVQDQALRAAGARIAELEQQVARGGAPQGQFAPNAPYGQQPYGQQPGQQQDDRYGQRPDGAYNPGGYPGYNPGQPQAQGMAPWGQRPQQPGAYPGYNPGQQPGGYDPGQQPGQPQPGQPQSGPWGQRPGAMGAPQGFQPQPGQQGYPQAGMAPQPQAQQPAPGGGFLRNAAAMAAGVAGGALLMNGISGLFGGAKTPGATNPAAAATTPGTGDLASQVNGAQTPGGTDDLASQVNGAQTPDAHAAHQGQGGSGEYDGGYDNANYDDNDFDGGLDGGDFA